MNIEKAKIYGVDKIGSADPFALVRTDDASGLSCTVRTTNIKSDFDSCYPWSDMHEVADEFGNIFVRIPKFYCKITGNSDGTFKHQISGVRYAGFTTLFIDGKGNELDYLLVGKYEGGGSAARVCSKSGATVLTNITLDNYRVACQANGKGYQQYDFLIDLIIKELFLIEFATTNSQAIMRGYTAGNSAALLTGRTDRVGAPSGSEESNTDGKHAMKYRGIENLWGNTFTFVDGISFSGQYVFICYEPEAYEAAKTTPPYFLHGNRTMHGSFAVRIEPLARNPIIQFTTSVIDGSMSTYYCDATYTGLQVLVEGGSWGTDEGAGLWYWNSDISTGFAAPGAGGRLCYKPI